jgi:tubulin polyglutamylase TTLL6/13
MCFEILGIDIFLDEKVKPWLIEVNALASFATDSPLDKRIKYDVVYEALAQRGEGKQNVRRMNKH